MSLKTTQLFGLFIGLVLFLVLANGLIINDNLRSVYTFAEGDISKETIRSPKSVIFKSGIKTNELAEQSVKDISKVYKLDQGAFPRQQEIITSSFEKIEPILQGDSTEEEKKQKLQSLFAGEMSDDLFTQIARLTPSERVIISEEVENILLDIHKTELITDETIDETKKKIASKIAPDFPPDQIEIVSFAARALLVTNAIPDEEEIIARKDMIKEQASPVYYQVKQDEVIVGKDSRIDALSIEKLEAVGLLSPGFALKEQIGTALLISILTILLFWYAIRSEHNVRRLAALLSILFVGTISLILISSYFLDTKPILTYVIPVAAAAIAIGLISKVRIGIFAGLFFTVVVSFSFGNLFDVLVVHSVLTIAGLLIFHGLERFRSVARPIAVLTIIHFILIISFHFLAGSIDLLKAGQLLLVSLAFSVSTVVIVFGLLILVSLVFKISTFPILLDLANPTSPLLRELSVKAPGTYHHSIIVGSLAERAVRDIGGNVLLAKVASYYHDIGKLNNPNFYIENKKTIPTDQDVSDPLKEAQRVMSHVDYGITIARKQRLPEEIIDVIREHHGTTVVLYFYNLSDKKSKENFRYKGPKPQTPESAIIMLADSIEAYVRSYYEQDHFILEDAVNTIIEDRLADGQLDESGLTLKDVLRVHRSFVEILASVYHERIAYE